MSADLPEAGRGPDAGRVADPREAYSYRHPVSGEWAHPRHCGPLEDAHRNYVDPAWELLEPRLSAHPNGPPGQERSWRALVIGFGRGFEVAALLRKHRATTSNARILITGLEPHPDLLAPWPPRWHEFETGEAPWWGRAAGTWPMETAAWRLEIVPQRAQDWLQGQPPHCLDLILLDLFSPGRVAQDWEPSIFPELARVAAPEAVLTTYTCARSVRDGLATTGWQASILRRTGVRDSLRATRTT